CREYPRHGDRAATVSAQAASCTGPSSDPAEGGQPPGQEQPSGRLQHASPAGERRRRSRIERTAHGSIHPDLGGRPRYSRLAYNADYENIDLVAYLREVVEDLEPAVAPSRIQLDAPREIQFAADRAILVALIV